MAKIISLLCRSADQTNDTMNGLLIQTDKQASDKAPYGCGPNEKGYTLSLFPPPFGFTLVL